MKNCAYYKKVDNLSNNDKHILLILDQQPADIIIVPPLVTNQFSLY